MTKVFVRPRPLAASEQGDGAVGFAFDAAKRSVAVAGQPTPFAPFAGVLSAANGEAFDAAVRPLVGEVHGGATACCFAYGYTNSGKTHTIFGYRDDAGMCQRAAAALFEAAPPPPLVQVRFYELYNGKVLDLLNGRQRGFVREDADGTIHVRSETTLGANGEVLTQSLHAEYGDSPQSVAAVIQRGMALRAAGTSELHTQSSRSHAVLEMEIVSPELAQARRELVQAKARVVPCGKARDDLYIAIQSKLYVQGADGKYAASSGAAASPEDEAQLEQLEAAVRRAELVVEDAQRRVDAAREAVQGGELVFVDLAGAEYTGQGLSRNAAELKEAREINTSLLALKECIRAQSSRGGHVPYRNAKLTMLLRDHLAPQNTTVMVATVSSAATQQPKAVDTIKYAALVAQALQAKA